MQKNSVNKSVYSKRFLAMIRDNFDVAVATDIIGKSKKSKAKEYGFFDLVPTMCHLDYTMIRKGLREIRRPVLTSSFDEYLFLFGKLLFVLLRKGEVQYTVFEACLDVLLGDVLADIEASLH